MAIYLSLGQVEEVAKILGEAYGEDAPCAVVYRASQPDERLILTRLKDLPARVKTEGITRQALILAGRVLEAGRENMGIRSKLYDKDFTHGFRK
jgi:precorrin-4/cobalt-precorrin-4 C11-methyltransferase